MKKRILSVILTVALCAGLSAPALAVRTFTDVPADYWAHDAIQYVVDEGLFSGTSGSTFTPGGTMTRAMLWVVLARMDGVDTSATNGGAWYQTGLDWAVEAGISDGTNANGSITRAQVATMLMRYATAFGDSQEATDPGEAEPERPSVDYTMYFGIQYGTLEVGKSAQAAVTVLPSSAMDDLAFTYQSSDTSVATVRALAANGNAVVTAVGPGTATITATDSNGVTSSARVIVTGEASSETPSTDTPSTSNSDEYEDVKDEIIALTNEVRAELGVAALTKSDLIMEIAQQRAEESAEMQAINHGRPDGTDMNTIFAEFGLDKHALQFGENLAQLGRPIAERAVTAWENSEGHFLTMTSSNKNYIGIGLAEGADGKYYCCMILTDKDRT